MLWLSVREIDQKMDLETWPELVEADLNGKILADTYAFYDVLPSAGEVPAGVPGFGAGGSGMFPAD
jgi:hypothetical protein